jgi:Ser/Thr protein kinase RdoA (MazF antagonist)
MRWITIHPLDSPCCVLTTPFHSRSLSCFSMRFMQTCSRSGGGEPMRILHGDLHQWNVRIARGVLSPIDFEDLMMGWPVQDIATTLYYFPAESYSELKDAFQEGYTRHNAWPERHPGEIDSFIAERGVELANFILNDPNPEWRYRAGEFFERVEVCLPQLLKKYRPS